MIPVMVVKPSSVFQITPVCCIAIFAKNIGTTYKFTYLINLYRNSECVTVNEMSVRKMLKVRPALERSNSHHIPMASATRVTDNSM